MGTALAVTVIFAIPIGILAAVKQYSWVDKVITTLATIGYAMPSFLLGAYLWYLGGVIFDAFPLYGMQTFGKEGDLLDVAWHMVLPVSSLAIQSIAGWARYVRASMLEVLHEDYIRTARAKGLSQRGVVVRHAIRNALIPIVTVLGIQFGRLLGGAVIVESVFAWPGIGRMVLQAVLNRDYLLVQGTLLLLVIAFIVVNLLVDLLYGVLDPRIRLAHGRG